MNFPSTVEAFLDRCAVSLNSKRETIIEPEPITDAQKEVYRECFNSWVNKNSAGPKHSREETDKLLSSEGLLRFGLAVIEPSDRMGDWLQTNYFCKRCNGLIKGERTYSPRQLATFHQWLNEVGHCQDCRLYIPLAESAEKLTGGSSKYTSTTLEDAVYEIASSVARHEVSSHSYSMH